MAGVDKKEPMIKKVGLARLAKARSMNSGINNIGIESGQEDNSSDSGVTEVILEKVPKILVVSNIPKIPCVLLTSPSSSSNLTVDPGKTQDCSADPNWAKSQQNKYAASEEASRNFQNNTFSEKASIAPIDKTVTDTSEGFALQDFYIKKVTSALYNDAIAGSQLNGLDSSSQNSTPITGRLIEIETIDEDQRVAVFKQQNSRTIRGEVIEEEFPKDDKIVSSGGSASSSPFKENFIDSIRRRSFHKKKSNHGREISPRKDSLPALPTDSHLVVPKTVSRSRSLSRLSDAFGQVHNVCILPAHSTSGSEGSDHVGRATSWYSVNHFNDDGTPDDASSEELDSRSQESEETLSDLSRKWSSLGHISSDSSLYEGCPLGSIKASDARQKNYLFGGLGSLLGPSELERYFPDRRVTIFIATWNMNGKDPPSSLDDFLLPDELDHMPDMYVIGTQESVGDRTEWEVRLQTTIGPSHVLFTSAVLGILHLTVFLRRDLVWFCTVPEEASYSLRPGTYFKTKGAVALSFQFFGTKILFVNTHLFAHEEKLANRIQNYRNIIHNLDVPRNLRGSKINKHKDVTHRYDIVFWMGDLNFRLVGDRDVILDKIKMASNSSSSVDMQKLMEYDQLTHAKIKGQIFHGFDEAPIKFPPTFKFDVGSNHYDTSYKQRIPSYTDRIFFKSTRDPITCASYTSCPLFKTSDHKPVCGVFTFKVRPGKDDVPLAAGLFQRDVYLAALKRRRRFFHQPSTKNCQMQ